MRRVSLGALAMRVSPADAPGAAAAAKDNPTYRQRSLSLREREEGTQQEAGDGERKAVVSEGVSAEFVKVFLKEVLPAFGMDSDVMKRPETHEQWMAKFAAGGSAEEEETIPPDDQSEVVYAAWGLSASKRAVAHARRLVNRPRCRDTGDDGKAWDLVEAEVRRPLPEGSAFTHATKVAVRPKARAMRHGDDCCAPRFCELCANDEKARAKREEAKAAEERGDQEVGARAH